VSYKLRFIGLLLLSIQTPFAYSTPLDQYVQQTDPSYSWKLEKTIEAADYTAFILHINSLTWRISSEVSPPLWQHWLTLIRPKKLLSDKALLYVNNGTSQEGSPSKPDPKWVEMARNTRSVIAELRNVPNQPLVYLQDGHERFEDDSVAYSWDKVMTTHDPSWSIRLPMVKSVIRAMDTVQAFLGSLPLESAKVKGFVVAGASKRGWATWLTAAVDKRVVAIIPLVIDVLNVQKALEHHYAVYGFWSSALKDYLTHRILERYQTPAFTQLMELEDPYSYKNRITVPKFMINASGDQFFLPDSSRFYFADLVGEKYLRYVPNADHSLNDTDAFRSLEAFYSSLIHKSSPFKYSWNKKKDGSIELKVKDKPVQVNLWQAHNPKGRDFRLSSIGKAFHSTPLKETGDGVYEGRIKPPKEGYTAFFIELTYKTTHSVFPLKFTTEVSVVPDPLAARGQ